MQQQAEHLLIESSMNSQKLTVLTALVSAIYLCSYPANAQDTPQVEQTRISGQCLRCLIEVRADMKQNEEHKSLDQVEFLIVESPTCFEITEAPLSKNTIKGGGMTYTCSKTSGKIIDRKGCK